MEEIRLSRGVILAIPPESALPLFQQMHIADKSLLTWTRDTKYGTYIPVSLHFDKPLPASISQVHGFPDTEWGIAFVVLSDYFENQKTGLISAVITMPNALSSYTGLSANQSNTEAQVVAEVIRQLQQRLSDQLPQPKEAFITPGVIYMEANQHWYNPNASYIAAANTQPWGPHTDMPGVYSLGTHNGHSPYSFTSMESAVSNALVLTNELEPSTFVALLSPWTLKPILAIVLPLLLLLAFILIVILYAR